MPASAQSSLVKRLRAFELGRRPARPERLDARRREIVDEAGDQRRLGPDDDEIDPFGAGSRRDRRVIGDVERRRFVPHCAVPGLPGAMNRRSQSGLEASFQASACSRPPEPIRRIRMIGAYCHTCRALTRREVG